MTVRVCPDHPESAFYTGSNSNRCIECHRVSNAIGNAIHNKRRIPGVPRRDTAKGQEARRLLAASGEGRYKGRGKPISVDAKFYGDTPLQAFGVQTFVQWAMKFNNSWTGVGCTVTAAPKGWVQVDAKPKRSAPKRTPLNWQYTPGMGDGRKMEGIVLTRLRERYPEPRYTIVSHTIGEATGYDFSVIDNITGKLVVVVDAKTVRTFTRNEAEAVAKCNAEGIPYYVAGSKGFHPVCTEELKPTGQMELTVSVNI